MTQKIKINDLLNNSKSKYGEKRFYTYNAFTYNCQDWLINLLNASNMNTPELQNFIKQDVKTLASPKLQKTLHAVTNFARVGKQIFGRGLKPQSSWITHVKEYAKTHNISYKEAMTQAKSTYKK